MSTFKRIALVLTVIGAINWGLIGFFQFDLVAFIFGGQGAALSRLLYSLIGLSGLVCLSYFFDPVDQTDSDRSLNTSSVNYGVEFGEDFEYDRNRDNDDNRTR
ncbi:DUF378 domain-containing protein [Amphibacillus sp. MSJ-3]|uniref:DUF378 domain-containing protein n=1 Tax=Amphibacillus sp. MSJ-3 TaxID=2841505 RepID=UPI001C0F3581|nr:DUF378 domain-containing protein [Amphibacillus sp. MSJ-3]MBU5593827.1 DUF378 domain-containing protein [Amphibacillus sp. MSJ-3]